MKNLLLLLPTIVMTLSAKSVYEYDLKSIDGDATNLTEHKGKVILMVNVASRCGFTRQYKGLEELYNKYKSIIHIDGTCRTQIVKDKNSITYKLLKSLKTKGSDILVNTSFNISKDPIVFDIYDVYVNMRRMNIKYVLMDDGLYEAKNI